MRRIVLSLLLPFCLAAQAPHVDYTRDVHPILATRCFVCHSAEKRSGGLSLATYEDALQGGRSGAAIVPKDSKTSLLMLRVTGENAPRMPLGGSPLAPQEIATLQAWIDEGARRAPDSAPAKPRWMPPLSLETPEVPPASLAGWDSPADRFLAAYLKAHNVSPAPLISDTQFARRAYLDVWGLLPSPEQLDAFLSDQASDKRQALVRRLLADKENYSENWVSYWNDLLRNDEGVNYAGDRKTITPWLLASLRNNLPYDQFVTALLNPTKKTDPEGFLIGVNWRGDISASQSRPLQAAQNSAQVFLGINLKCNSCHDSFISRWKLRDAYSLAAYFTPDEKLQLYRCDKATGDFATVSFLYPQLNEPLTDKSEAARHALAAKLFTEPQNGRTPRTLVNRIWARLMGRGIVEPVDDMDAEPWDPALLDWLASDFVANHYDIKHLIETIMLSRAYQMPAVSRESKEVKDYVFTGPEVRRLSAEEFSDSLRSITGEWRTFAARGARTATWSRDWRIVASPLSVALGRPIRDQVYTERNNDATTLQALEMVNGDTINKMLNRGALRLLGELPAAPRSLYDSGAVRTVNATIHTRPKAEDFDIDISKVSDLRLLTYDEGSYAPEKTLAAWADARLIDASGNATPLSQLKPASATGLRDDATPIQFPDKKFDDGIRTWAAAELVYSIAGKGFVRFQGSVGLDTRCYTSEINPNVRYFVFDQKPDMDELLPVTGATPAALPPQMHNKDELVDRLFRQAFGRLPSDAEKKIALAAVDDPQHPGQPCAAGVADLLWSLAMSPEFQLVM
ncbi:MAG TPA: DUF1549 domain-containing protein [Bryobacteraceae bacterium]|jgi:hypothetical protein